MCNLSKGIEEKGRKEGIISSVKNLMDTMDWSAEQAMKALKVSKEDQEKYLVMLKKQ